jgi:hypothetical protein
VVGFVVVLVLLASAGLPPFGKTADQLVGDAAANLTAAPAVKVDASFTRGGTAYSMSWQADRSGDLIASVSFKGSKDGVISVGGKAWIDTDKAFWDNLGRTDALAQKVLPGHWMVVAPGGSVVAPDVPDPASLRGLLPTGPSDLTTGPTRTTDGQRTLKLSDGRADIYVTAGEPTRLVRLVFAPGYTDRTGISGLDAAFAYPKSLRVAAPSDFYDPTNPNSLPGEYTVDQVNRGRCDGAGCVYALTVHNHYGMSGGQATATVRLTTQSGGSLGACSAPIPQIGYNQTETVSCTVSGPTWASFFNNGTGTLHWFRQADVHNPIWDD